jgi:hypothetical protein
MAGPAAPESPPPARSTRGGSLAKTARHQFEVFFYKTGLRVFPKGVDGTAVDVARLTGTATFSLPGAPNPFVYPLRGAAAPAATSPASLDLTVDLGRVPASGSKVTFQIEGLADPAEPSATFTVPFVLTTTASPVTVAAPPRVVPAVLSVSRATAADQAPISAQRVCKVSGEPLGSMGTPVKVTRGDRAIYLCCQGCVKSVQANPDRYLGAR